MPDFLGVASSIGQGRDLDAIDYLGRRAPVAFKGQPALPTGAGAPPPGVSSGPVTTPEGFAAEAGPGTPPQQPPSAGEDELAQLLEAMRQIFKLGEFAEGAIGPILGPERVGSSQILEDAEDVPFSADTIRATAPPPIPPEWMQGTEYAGMGFDAMGSAYGLEGAAPVTSEALTGAYGLDPASVSPEVWSQLGPYLSLAGLGYNIFGRASSDMPAEEQAVHAAIDALAFASLFTPAAPAAVFTPAFHVIASKFFKPDVPHEVREGMEAAEALGQTQHLLYEVPRADSPEALLGALQSYGQPSNPDVNALHLYSGGKPLHEMTTAELLGLDPGSITAAVQAGVSKDKLAPAESIFARSVADQLRVLQDASRGDPAALTYLDAVRQANRAVSEWEGAPVAGAPWLTQERTYWYNQPFTADARLNLWRMALVGEPLPTVTPPAGDPFGMAGSLGMVAPLGGTPISYAT